MSSTAAQGDALAAYRELLDHAERELELAGRGEIAGVLALGAHWDELVGGLPKAPPREAAGLLERARLMHERTRVELLRLREALLVDIATARRSQRTAAGYAGTVVVRPRLDRSA